jgi:hypothetical protein
LFVIYGIRRHFVAALVRLRNAELYTGNLEFKVIGKEIKVVWLKSES